jgi:hypothetical protein
MGSLLILAPVQKTSAFGGNFSGLSEYHPFDPSCSAQTAVVSRGAKETRSLGIALGQR